MHEGENSQLVPATRARRRISSTRWEQIKTAYASGIGLREMARNMGIPAGTVLARAKREGWTRQVESAKAVVRREDAPLAVTPVEAVAISMQERGERHIERMAGVSERAVDQIEKLDKVARRTFALNDNPFPSGFTLNVLNISGTGVQIGDTER